MIIRPAKTTETDQLTTLGIQSKSTWGYPNEFMATFRTELAVTSRQIELGLVYLVEVDSLIVGYYMLKPIDATTVELEHLFVSTDHFRKGYGSALLKHAIDEAKRRDFVRMKIQSDPNAAGFYEKSGLSKSTDIPSSIPGRLIPEYDFKLE